MSSTLKQQRPRRKERERSKKELLNIYKKEKRPARIAFQSGLFFYPTAASGRFNFFGEQSGQIR
jgi:hypothetical protein